ncbi:hypothetical protein Tco_0803370 [Tanacetum coccineum]|uniref:Uncharacterized protein n=1 Tax=Tanacetum coccineum TaxID=301880 RepID=A0ABQ5A5G9_9ASTR
MVESPFSKFKEDKVRMLSVQDHKGMLQAEGKELVEEQLAFLPDLGVADGQVAQTITRNAAFQTDDLDAYDSDCDDISFAKRFLWPISQVVIQIFFLRQTRHQRQGCSEAKTTPSRLRCSSNVNIMMQNQQGSLLQWCYKDDVEILKPVKSRSHIIRLAAPVTHEASAILFLS